MQPSAEAWEVMEAGLQEGEEGDEEKREGSLDSSVPGREMRADNSGDCFGGTGRMGGRRASV